MDEVVDRLSQHFARSKIQMRGIVQLIFIVCLVGAGDEVFAARSNLQVEIVPSEVEWMQWPAYCRARYAISLYARQTEYADRVPRGEIQNQKNQMGAAWDSLHHHCYGLVQMSRAQLEPDDQSRKYLLGRAVDEFAFVHRSTPRAHAFWAHNAVQLGNAHKELGEFNPAVRYLEEAIGAQPVASAGYAALAEVYWDSGNLGKAREILQKGIRATNGSSAELHYFMGLVLLEQGELKAARSHADEAYKRGYPLPGLREKLSRLD